MADAEAIGRELLVQAGIEVGGDAPWDITVHDDRVWERALRDRELGLGEAYQEGWWDAPRVDEFLAKVMAADLRSAVRRSPRLLHMAAVAALTNRQTVRKAFRNASAHYDIGNDLYERMLDKRMVYSCGYWRNASDLDTAQEAKLELICAKLHLQPGTRVLDIGCGWGGFAQYAAERYGAHVTGITPAGQQVRIARERCADLPVRIEQLDYRDASGTYDRIVSIGMMEHVGSKNLERFFAVCGDLLAEDGIMLHHTIGSNETKQRADPWFDKYIFPGGATPSLRQIARASERRWAVEDVHNFGPDYDRTLLAWHDNVEAAWAELPRYDERFRRTWRYYLLTSAAAFRVRDLQLWQIVFRRTKRPSDVYQTAR